MIVLCIMAKDKGGRNRRRTRAPRKVPNRHLLQAVPNESSSDEAPDIQLPQDDIGLGGPSSPVADTAAISDENIALHPGDLGLGRSSECVPDGSAAPSDGEWDPLDPWRTPTTKPRGIRFLQSDSSDEAPDIQDDMELGGPRSPEAISDENIGIPPGDLGLNDASGGRTSEGRLPDGTAGMSGPNSSDGDWDASDSWGSDIIDASDRLLAHFVEGSLEEPDPLGPAAINVVDCVSEADSSDSEDIARLGWEIECGEIDWSDDSLGGWDLGGGGVVILNMIRILMLMMKAVGKVKMSLSWHKT